ncbi:hypothetical protein RJT34_22715 [Clitoria ternatea]|uniref:Aldehyde dehydrogenase domain-containing protein n=1 Tax=Clitoria ternatea TaxID=43366 RepID=A0AAN9FKI4_CLITE
MKPLEPKTLLLFVFFFFRPVSSAHILSLYAWWFPSAVGFLSASVLASASRTCRPFPLPHHILGFPLCLVLRIFSPEAPCEVIDAERHSHVFFEPEPDIWMVMAGIPDGVLNAVPGFGPTAGAAVSFTGSIEVGREVMQAAAKSNLKPVSLELGGKSPLIIFNDADIDKATDLALFGSMLNKGEACVASSCVFVQEGIYDEFKQMLVEKAKSWISGDPFDPKSQHGP